MDNDEVLVHTEHLYFPATAETLQSIGVELTRKKFIEISLRKGRSAFSLARDKGLTAIQMDELRRDRNNRYAALLRRGVKAITGVEETLQALYGRVQMAIVTSSRRDHFDLIHISTGLSGYFDFVLPREDYSHPKPHPEPYLRSIGRSGLHPEECVVIEDSERGLRSRSGPCRRSRDSGSRFLNFFPVETRFKKTTTGRTSKNAFFLAIFPARL